MYAEFLFAVDDELIKKNFFFLVFRKKLRLFFIICHVI